MRSKVLQPKQIHKICSEHFLQDDFIEPESNLRRLKKEAVPSLFKWTKNIEPKQQHLTSEKLSNSRAEQEEETDTSSEAETEICNEGLNTISRKV